MDNSIEQLAEKLAEKFTKTALSTTFNELTLVVDCANIIEVCTHLKEGLNFDTLIDLCGVDYLSFGKTQWQTDASGSGFSRAKFDLDDAYSELGTKNSTTTSKLAKHPARFAVVYHLLSTTENYRLRVKTYLNEENILIDSVVKIWQSANWYEREAFDLFGILFKGHEDLRRILTDYGFVGHPLRKDFPMIGEVEMRYDEKLGKVIYEPVSIKPYINTPKVIR